MGASRNVKANQQRSVIELDHELETPASEVPSLDEVRRALDDRLRQSAESSQPYQARPIDPTLREKYGRYADTMSEAPQEADQQPDIEQTPRWPYRKPEPPQDEAQVNLHVAANSNTSPFPLASNDPDNVIPMPVQRTAPHEISEDQAAIQMPAPQEDYSAFQQVTRPTGNTAPMEVPEVILQPTTVPVARPEPENGINVRITERTADFTVPVTDAALPQRILQTVQQADMAQLSMDLAQLDGNDDARQQTQLIEQAPASSQAVTEDVIEVISTIEQSDEFADELYDDVEEIQLNEASDDPMLQVAHRFAVNRAPAE